MKTDVILSWTCFWAAASPLAAWLGYRAGRAWKAKFMAKRFIEHLMQRVK